MLFFFISFLMTQVIFQINKLDICYFSQYDSFIIKLDKNMFIEAHKKKLDQTTFRIVLLDI